MKRLLPLARGRSPCQRAGRLRRRQQQQHDHHVVDLRRADAAPRQARRRLRPPGARILERPGVAAPRSRTRRASSTGSPSTSRRSSASRKNNVSFLRAPFATILLAGKKPFDFAMEETTITAAAREGDRLLGSLLRREPGRAARQGREEADVDRRPQEPADLRAGGDDRPRLDPAQAAPGEAAARLLGVVGRGVQRRAVGRVPGADPRRADHRGAERRSSRARTAASSDRSTPTRATARCSRRTAR